MPKIVIGSDDSGQSFGGSFNPVVDEGTYKAKITGAKTEVDRKGREKVVLDFEVFDASERSGANGQGFRKWFYMHHPESKRIAIEQMEGVGAPAGWNYKNADKLVGKECRIQLVVNSNDRNYMEVKTIMQRFVPAGTYKTVVDDVGKVETAKKSDGSDSKPFFRVFHKITEGPMAGLKIMDRLFVSEKSMKVTAAKLGAMGASVGEFDTDSDRDRQSLKGLRCEISYAEQKGSDGTVVGSKIMKITSLGRGGNGDSEPATRTPEVEKDGSVDVAASDIAGAEPEEEFEDEDDIPF